MPLFHNWNTKLEKLMGTTEKITVEVEGKKEDVEAVLEALEEEISWNIKVLSNLM